MSGRLPSVAGMRTRPDHREAVARRLELLRAELEPADGLPEPPADDPVPVPRYLELVAEEPDPPIPDDPPVVPVPGRHAARRSRSAPEWVPATLRGRVHVGAWHVAVVALLVAAGLGVTCWLVVRGDAETAAPATLSSAAPLVGVPVASASPAVPVASASVTVDVAGKVRRPGVRVLPAGSRVIDAVQAAGGARQGVDLAGLNQARLLVDGEQIVVGGPPAAAAATGGGAAPAPGSGAPGALVNLNTATAEQLDGLPEVGPVTAQAILDWRQQHGGFGSVDELLEIDGIGEVTLQKIAPHVTV